MSKRQLTQEEIDECFNGDKNGGSSSYQPDAFFDFRRLDKLAKSQLNSIHLLHEQFVRSMSASLSVYLRSYVSGNLICVEQTTFGDFADALPSPTCLVHLSMKPYDGCAVIEINQPLLSPILDLVLGGNGKMKSELKRDITELEESILGGLFRIIANDLAETWRPIAAIEFAVEKVETKPQLSRRLDRAEGVVAIAMEMHIGDLVGMFNLAIPSLALKTMRHKFEQQRTIQVSQRPEINSAIKNKIARELMIELACEGQASRIRLSDFLRLKPGDVIDLGMSVDEPLDVVIGGKRKFKCELASLGRRTTAVIVSPTDLRHSPPLRPPRRLDEVPAQRGSQ